MSVGLIGGFMLGCREALITLHQNAFVQAGQYFSLYVAVPILTAMLFFAAVLFMCAVGLRVWTRFTGLRPDTLSTSAAVLGFVGAVSLAAPWAASATQRLQSVGVPLGWSVTLTLWVLVLAAAAAAAAVMGAAAAWASPRITRGLRVATRAVVTVGIVLLWPVVHFLATDWRWSSPLPEAGAASTGAPNVLLVSIDTLRADHLRAYGDQHDLTPHLDRLAAEGVVFDHAITSAPWTLPAMASLFTGLYPRHHGAGAVLNGRDLVGRTTLQPGTWTLATALRDAGYRTHAIVTNGFLALHYGFGDGFQSYENVTIMSEAFIAFGRTTALALASWLYPGLVVGDRGETVSDRAVRWLATAASPRPFLLWLHYVDPHPPYSRPGVSQHKSMRGEFSLASEGTAAVDLSLTSPDMARLRSGEVRLNPNEKQAMHDLYRDEVATVDRAIGSVLEALDRYQLTDHTLVVVVGDHGEEFWEHGGVEHGRTVYDEVVRIPLLMRWPDHLPAKRRVTALVRITDVAPTVLDLLGVGFPPASDGASTLPLVRGVPEVPRVALMENMLFAEERVGVRTATHKYVRWATGKEELYDLTADPAEQRDIAANEALLAVLRATYAALDSTPSPTAAAPAADARTTQALRSLGYVN